MGRLFVPPRDHHRGALEGVFPSTIATRSRNLAFVSQVQVDADHVAVSERFLKRTLDNFIATSRGQAFVVDPSTAEQFRLDRPSSAVRLTDRSSRGWFFFVTARATPRAEVYLVGATWARETRVELMGRSPVQPPRPLLNNIAAYAARRRLLRPGSGRHRRSAAPNASYVAARRRPRVSWSTTEVSNGDLWA